VTTPSISRIQLVVATVHRIGVIDMIGRNQNRETVRPRQIAMYLALDMTGHSLSEIAISFGRDRKTVINADRKVQHIMGHDLGFRDQVELCRKAVGEPQLLHLVDEAGVMIREVVKNLRNALMAEAIRDPEGLMARLRSIPSQEIPPCV